MSIEGVVYLQSDYKFINVLFIFLKYNIYISITSFGFSFQLRSITTSVHEVCFSVVGRSLCQSNCLPLYVSVNPSACESESSVCLNFD
uniref:Uncharacterized protein n=1 Tax=Anguilla anguilla TaxID=7936 RepID=A0A0E9VHG1_ANGAN